MATNHSKLLGMYELSTFLAQINVYRGKGLKDSRALHLFVSMQWKILDKGHWYANTIIIHSTHIMCTVHREYFVVNIFLDSLACAKIKCAKMQY